MDADLKQKWIKALESGRYKQAAGTLRLVKDGKVAGYCCLGVLCQISKMGKWGKNDSQFQFNNPNENGHPTYVLGDLSGGGCEIVGLEETVMEELCKINDDGQYDFKFIANYIKDNV